MLRKVAKFQYRYYYLVMIFAILVTAILGVGIYNIRLQTDISKELPQDLDVIKLQNEVSSQFGGSDTVLVLVRLNESCNIENAPRDIRDYRVLKMLLDLESRINDEPEVEDVRSVAGFFSLFGFVPRDQKTINSILNNVPESAGFFNKDYTATVMFVSADLGKGEKKIDRFTSRLRADINSIEKPPCVSVEITGNPPIRVVLLRMIQHDLFYTMGIAGVIIFLFIFFVRRSLSESVLVLFPLMIGLTWLLGIMGWLDIPLSVATVGIGAMILGLGTEYGIFLVERYKEEREKGKSQSTSLEKALPSVGSGIIGSGTTTIAGFLALLMASMPMIQHLGETLALGIFCILFVTIFISPSIIIFEERIFRSAQHHNKKGRKNLKRYLSLYSDFLYRNYKLVLILLLAFTIISIFGAVNVKTEGIAYKDMLPKNVEEIEAMNYIGDEFGSSGESITILVKANPSSGCVDIRRPDIMRYEDILEQKIRNINGVSYVTGAPDIIKELNNGRIPKSERLIKELMRKKIRINETFSFMDNFKMMSSGLENVSTGLFVESQIMDNLSYGLNATSYALDQISNSISYLGQSLNRPQNLSNVQQTISLIDQIELLVQYSNATPQQKGEIIGYLEGLKYGLMSMVNESEKAQEGIFYLSQSLLGLSNAIRNISLGLSGMANVTNRLSNMSSGMGMATSNMALGLDEMMNYLKPYFEDTKKREMEGNLFSRYVSDDYYESILIVGLRDLKEKDKMDVVNQIEDILNETSRPSGISVGFTGGPVITKELKKQVLPTMRKTSTASLIAILIIVSLLFLSVRFGLISLLALVFGIIWVYGITGILGVPINSTMSGALSMIMGIGIDFGIQVVNRFRQERKNADVRKAVKTTLSNVFVPMLITTLAALIGFRAMSMGQLTLLGDLGNMMSLGILFCFIAAVTVIPSVLVLVEKRSSKR